MEFFPTRVRIPQTTTLEKALYTAKDLVKALQHPDPSSPLLTFGNQQYSALQQLADIFDLGLQNQDLPSVPRVATQSQTITASVPRVKTVTFSPILIQPSNGATPQTTTPLESTLAKLSRARRSQQPLRRSTRLRAKAHRQRRTSLLQRLASNPKYKQFTVNHVELKIQHFLANPVLDPTTGRSLEYRHLVTHRNEEIRKIWEMGMCNELGRLAQGFKSKIKGTDCVEFIPVSQIPRHKRATYARIVAEIRPQKEDPYRVRITAGGNLIHYPWDKSQPTADLTTVKMHINSTISTPGANYACLDIKNMYLMSLMQNAEYMFIEEKLVPQQFIEEYKLQNIIQNGKLYMKIKRGMYGLPQAGKLAFDKLKAHLVPLGYAPCRLTLAYGSTKHGQFPSHW